MKMTPMRYKSYVWPNNPHTLRIAAEKEITQFILPGTGGAVRYLGGRARVVEISGEFFGSAAFAHYAELAAVFAGKQAGQLVIPGMEPFFAYFSLFETTGEPGPAIIGYRCVFIENPALVLNNRPSAASHTVKKGENLWDIAAKYGVSLERLLQLNSWIRDPFEPSAGGAVRLI